MASFSVGNILSGLESGFFDRNPTSIFWLRFEEIMAVALRKL
jgi:hypothetical protein